MAEAPACGDLVEGTAPKDGEFVPMGVDENRPDPVPEPDEPMAQDEVDPIKEEARRFLARRTPPNLKGCRSFIYELKCCLARSVGLSLDEIPLASPTKPSNSGRPPRKKQKEWRPEDSQPEGLFDSDLTDDLRRDVVTLSLPEREGDEDYETPKPLLRGITCMFRSIEGTKATGSEGWFKWSTERYLKSCICNHSLTRGHQIYWDNFSSFCPGEREELLQIFFSKTGTFKEIFSDEIVEQSKQILEWAHLLAPAKGFPLGLMPFRDLTEAHMEEANRKIAEKELNLRKRQPSPLLPAAPVPAPPSPVPPLSLDEEPAPQEAAGDGGGGGEGSDPEAASVSEGAESECAISLPDIDDHPTKIEQGMGDAIVVSIPCTVSDKSVGPKADHERVNKYMMGAAVWRAGIMPLSKAGIVLNSLQRSWCSSVRQLWNGESDLAKNWAEAQHVEPLGPAQVKRAHIFIELHVIVSIERKTGIGLALWEAFLHKANQLTNEAEHRDPKVKGIWVAVTAQASAVGWFQTRGLVPVVQVTVPDCIMMQGFLGKDSSLTPRIWPGYTKMTNPGLQERLESINESLNPEKKRATKPKK